ncbi:endonuclease/exonuclease/phosphatase family protein [Sinorhizobium fredii]|uniref:Endonuclease/exonuclease/phosphatase family protein n=1 Tax=Rhizobium fredii TaxID=380 RepID=A0A2L0H0C7_RHIFR|nr:endonuclease/exonuclease/phosphatase family protein [Sinorhizobium fredii]AUX74935.1 endonuclease/exonuclease/phosphatase family protein [Sinorhizobium fredii]
MIEKAVSTLAVPSREHREGIARTERSIPTHDAIMAGIEAMNTIEVGGAATTPAPLAFPFTVAAWNLERCLFPEESAEHLRATGARLVLLSEMDNGMARTGQRHTTAEIASALEMQYAYGVEFIELGLGSDTEREFCKDDFNDKGFHGNALLTAVPLRRPFLLRLCGERLWFRDETDQPRLGERCAVGAVIETEAGPFVAVSTHLESATTAAYRERQMKELIDQLDTAFPELPILIGGDLNTGNHIGGDFEAEGLFAASAARGFTRHGGPLDQMTTRPSLITRWPKRAMKLDWFLARGLKIGESRIVPSLDTSGRPLSDHDLITCLVEGFQ